MLKGCYLLKVGKACKTACVDFKNLHGNDKYQIQDSSHFREGVGKELYYEEVTNSL